MTQEVEEELTQVSALVYTLCKVTVRILFFFLELRGGAIFDGGGRPGNASSPRVPTGFRL